MTATPISTIGRLPLYLRALTQVAATGQRLVSSEELSRVSGVSPALIRKDLSLFGGFGKRGRGYAIDRLQEALISILHLDADWDVALVGAGPRGRVLLDDMVIRGRGFRITALFDDDPALVGQTLNELVVQPMSALSETLRRRSIKIAVLASPPESAQSAADQLVMAGVWGILNYVPVSVRVPDHIVLHSIDAVSQLQQITFYLRPQFI